MRRMLIVGAALLSCVGLFAQEDQSSQNKRYEQSTLLPEGGRPTGVFIAPGARISEVNDQTSVFAGGQLAMVLGHQFNVGIAVYAMLSETESELNSISFFPPKYLEMGYAGMLLEPVFFDRSVVHLTIPTIVGIGAGSTNYYRIWEEGYYDYSGHRSDVFFVVEPGANVEVNIARPLRLYAGGSYRFVVESDLYPDSDQSLSGFSINFGLKLGWF